MDTKKQLFIGLGGQGARSIRAIRKVIYERQLNAKANSNAAECRISCAYLSIDSSGDHWKKEAWMHMGKDLSLSESERCKLFSENLNVSASNTVPWLYSKDRKVAIAQQSEFANINVSTPGAQQRRRYGRALFAANVDGPGGVYSSIAKAMARLDKIDAKKECVISVFCSLGGGTGSGGIIDLITLLRQQYPSKKNYPLNLYIYLADSDGVDPDAVQGYFYENQYAALRDLNALATGLMQPHALVEVDKGTYIPGVRCSLSSPLDAVIISSNTTSANKGIGIEEQIQRVAEWVVDRAIVTANAPDTKVTAIATGEDFSTETHGEPNDTSDTFLERAYVFASLGAAKWEAPVNQLSLMAVYSIMTNSCRQMLYNNHSEGEGYMNTSQPLTDKKKADFNRLVAESFMLHQYVSDGWAAWAADNVDIAEIQKSTWDARGQRALIRMEAVFEDFFNNVVSNLTSNEAGSVLSLPGRQYKMLEDLKTALQLPNSSATCVHEILNDFLMQKLVEEWDAGEIGLYQAQEIVKFAADSARACKAQLQQRYEDILDTGRVMTPMLRSKELRSHPEIGEWNKLTALSFKVKGKEFLKAHLADLVAIYTAKTQRAHLLTFIQELDRYAANLDQFKIRLDTPIECLLAQVVANEEKYQDVELRRYIMGNDRPGTRDLEFDFDLQDSKVRDVVNFVNGDKSITKANARDLRAIVKDSIFGGATLADLFGGNKRMSDITESALMSKSYELAGVMLRAADKAKGTKLMEGLVSRVKNMSEEEVADKFNRLLTNATFSYEPEDANVSPSSVAGYGMRNAYRKAWIVSYPKNIKLPGIGEGKQNIEDAVISATSGAGQNEVFVVPSEDTTKISVWQTEFARPARCAKVVSFLRQRYDELVRNASVQKAFWLNIDDLEAEMAASVMFPTKKELAGMKNGAIWIASHCPGYFTINEGTGEIFAADDERPLFDTNEQSNSDSSITRFAFSVQNQLRNAVKDDNHGLLSKLKSQYEQELESMEKGSPNRQSFMFMVDKFIKPTLFRIAKAEQVVDYLQQYGVKPL